MHHAAVLVPHSMLNVWESENGSDLGLGLIILGILSVCLEYYCGSCSTSTESVTTAMRTVHSVVNIYLNIYIIREETPIFAPQRLRF